MENHNPLKKGNANPVNDRLLKFHDRGLSVAEAKAQMLAAKEPVRFKNGTTTVPKFLR